MFLKDDTYALLFPTQIINQHFTMLSEGSCNTEHVTTFSVFLSNKCSLD